MSNGAKILDFIMATIDGGTDQVNAFFEDPVQLMTGYGLDEKQQRVLLSGDVVRIQHAIEFESDQDWAMIRMVIFGPPPPPPASA
jgi:hypothetical protein